MAPPRSFQKIMGVCRLLALLTPLAALGQTTVFNDTFVNGSTLESSSPSAPTANSTSYDLLSTKGNETSCTLAANDFTLKLNSATSSGYWEIEALFTTTPLTLVNVGDTVALLYVFTNTGGTLNAHSSSYIFSGLYYSGSPQSPPTFAVNTNGGLTTASGSLYATGNAANWEGYVQRAANVGPSYLDIRPVQNGSGTASANQDVVGDDLGGGSYDNPAGAQISTVTSNAPLTSGGTYTEVFSVTLAAGGGISINNSIYSGIYNGLATGGTAIFTQTGTTSTAFTSFDALAIGARSSGSPSLNPTMDISQITVFQASASSPGLAGLTNQTVVAGNSATLSAAVSGFPPPSLQWYLSTDGGNTSNAISEATSSTLSLADVQYSQNNDQYTLVASNATAVVASTMTLTVTVTPIITGLNNQEATVGNNVTISPTVSGEPAPALQWQTNGVNLADGPDANGSTISGSATSTLVITDVKIADGKMYSLIASNSAGQVTNSMTLSVVSGNIPPVILGLTNQTVLAGDNATLSATVSGTPTPVLQWWLSTDGGNTSNTITGATSSTLPLTDVQYNQPSYEYTLVASNSLGVAASQMTLTVIVPPIITVQPVSEIVSASSNATFTVVSANGEPAPAYLWFSNGTANPNATSATYVIAGAQLANAGSYYVVVSNVAGSVTSSAVTLTVVSLGSPIWTGANSATDLYWSDGANWVGGSGPAGVPGPADNVSFFDYGATNNSQLQVDNIVDGANGNFGGTIASLQYGNTNGYHTTLISNGVTLNVTGPGGLSVFTPGDTDSSSTLYAAITGANGTLNLSNTSANLVVNEGTGGSSTPTATLDMSGLGTFTANISRIGLSTVNLPNSGGSDNRLCGNLYLALTNSITLSYAPPAADYLVGGATNALEMSVNKDNGANETHLYLGWQNQFFVDSIGVGRDKSTGGRYEGFMEFNPNGSYTSPTAYFRGIGGSSSLVTWWGIGDMNGSGSSAQAASGTVDFSNGGNSDGALDALVDTMSLGRDGSAASTASAQNIGTLNFTIGTLNVNTLILGNQSLGPIGNVGACVGLLNINAGSNPTETNALLIVNDNLILGNTTVNSPAAQGSYGVLTVNNGTVLANNVSVGAYTLSAQNGISLTTSALLVSNSLAAAAPGLANLTLNGALLGLPVNANATPSALIQTLNNSGAQIQLLSVPQFPSYPTNIMLIQCLNNATGTNGLSLAPSEPPGAAGASLALDPDGQSIDIQLIAPVTVGSFGLSNGHFELTVTGGGPGLNYEIQTSSNLTTWTTVSTNNSPTLPFQYVDPGLIATNHARFYRVVAGSSLP